MRVLIAHANEASRTKLADAVTRGRRLSLDILTAGDGSDALGLLLDDDPPEVALIDWDLPGIEAPEMCRLVRDFHHHHDTWLIVLTGATHREQAGEVWRAGGDDCVFTPAPAKLLSDRVTKGLCEMAPPIREAAAAAEAAARLAAEEAARQSAARQTLRAVATAGAQLVPEVREDDDGAQPAAAARPALDAVCRQDAEVFEEEPAGLAADLRATVDPEDLHESVELAATPAELAAQSIEPDDFGEASRGQATLDAVLARL
jgi:DNA-binding response OmpR family regulator